MKDEKIYRCRFKLENKYLKEYGCYEYEYKTNRIYYYIVGSAIGIHGLIELNVLIMFENQIFILDDKHEKIGVYDADRFNYFFEDLRLQDERKAKLEKLNSLNESNNNR